jgi:transcription factor IIIB subunit 2
LQKVLEENTIVAEITFGETSGGRAILQGSFAGDSGNK